MFANDHLRKQAVYSYIRDHYRYLLAGLLFSAGTIFFLPQGWVSSLPIRILLALICLGVISFSSAWFSRRFMGYYPDRFIRWTVVVALILGVIIAWNLSLDTPAFSSPHTLQVIFGDGSQTEQNGIVILRKVSIDQQSIPLKKMTLVRGTTKSNDLGLLLGPETMLVYPFVGNKTSVVRVAFSSIPEGGNASLILDRIHIKTINTREQREIKLSPAPIFLDRIVEALMYLVLCLMIGYFSFGLIVMIYALRDLLSRNANIFLIVLVILAFCLIFWRGINIGLDSAFGVYDQFNFLGGISRVYYGVEGYLMYCGLSVQDILKSGTLQDVSQQGLCALGNNDQGMIDFAALSFVLFGLTARSFYYTWFLFFGVSLIIYLLYYKKQTNALFLVLILEMSIYAVIFFFPGSEQLGSIANNRALGLLSSVSFLHLLFVVLYESELSIWQKIAIIIQSILMCFVYFCRVSVAYQMIGVIAVAIFAPIVRMMLRNEKWPPMRSMISMRSSLKPIGRYFVRAGFPVISLLIGLMALRVYQTVSYVQLDGKSRLTHHTVWHNIGVGLVYHPVFRDEFSLKYGDRTMVNLVNRWTRANQPDAPWLLSSTEPEVYENSARDIVLDVATKYPKEFIENIVYYKPKRLLFVMNEIMGLGSRGSHRYEWIEYEPSSVLYKPFRIEMVFLIAAGILLMFQTWKDHSLRELCVLILPIPLVFCLTAAIPWLLAYPEIHIIMEWLAFYTMSVYAVISLIIFTILRGTGFGRNPVDL